MITRSALLLFASLAAVVQTWAIAQADLLPETEPETEPGPSPEPSPQEPHGFQPFEVGAIFSALEGGGALAVTGNDGPFLAHVLEQIRAFDFPGIPDLEGLREILDAAILGYGGPTYPKFSDEVVAAVRAALIAALQPPAPPEA